MLDPKRRGVGLVGVDAMPPPPPPPPAPKGPPPEPPEATRNQAVSVLSDGVHVVCQCGVDGSTRDVRAEWPEIVCLSMGVSPHRIIRGMTEWVLTAQGWCPIGVHCSNCGASPPSELRIYITQPEAKTYIETGKSQRLPYFWKPRQSEPSFCEKLVRHIQSCEGGA